MQDWLPYHLNNTSHTWFLVTALDTKDQELIEMNNTFWIKETIYGKINIIVTLVGVGVRAVTFISNTSLN